MDSNITKISEARFRALSYSIHPAAYNLGIEIDWYADKNEYLIATIVFDYVDKDWGYVIMGRDENHIFRYITSQLSLSTEKDAKALLLEVLKNHLKNETRNFSANSGQSNTQDVFELRVHENVLHNSFKLLRNKIEYSSAKEIIREIGYNFTDSDGRFIEDFQTSGFDQRLWELYLYAYLHEESFTIDTNLQVPDFCCIKNSIPIFIEATTTNLSDGECSDALKGKYKSDYLAVKLAKSLMKKLSKRYHEIKHVAGNPLIFAIQPFADLYDVTSITKYLYGLVHKYCIDKNGQLVILPIPIEMHTHADRQKKSGFFFFPEAENVSAVIFGNCGTISKFNRMGKLAGFGSDKILMSIHGVYYDFSPNSTEPVQRINQVEPNIYYETWGQGLSMYHNPNARYPVDPHLFKNICHHRYRDGLIISDIHSGCDLMTSQTYTIVK